jgi:hypothetical protein
MRSMAARRMVKVMKKPVGSKFNRAKPGILLILVFLGLLVLSLTLSTGKPAEPVIDKIKPLETTFNEKIETYIYDLMKCGKIPGLTVVIVKVY